MTPILYVINGLNTGGTEKQLKLLIENLPKDFDPIIFSFLSEGNIIIKGCKTYYGFQSLKSSKTHNILALIVNFIFLLFIVIKNSPKVIHSFLPQGNFFSAVVGRLTFNKKIICSWRGVNSYREKSIFFKFIDKISLSLSHANTFNSKKVYKSVWSSLFIKENKKNKVIYNGLDFSEMKSQETKFYSTKNKKINLISIGNLYKYKGHIDLLKALKKLLDLNINNFECTIVGEDRGEKEKLEEFIKQNNLKNHVNLYGKTEKIYQLLSVSDIGILPSHEEGFSNALLEMLSSGLPVIATNVGGNPEALENMPNCFILEPKKPKELSKAIISLMDIVISKKDAPQSRVNQIIKKYSVEKMINSYLNIYIPIRNERVENQERLL